MVYVNLCMSMSSAVPVVGRERKGSAELRRGKQWVLGLFTLQGRRRFAGGVLENTDEGERREEREREEGELRRGGSINRRKREEKEWGKEYRKKGKY